MVMIRIIDIAATPSRQTFTARRGRSELRRKQREGHKIYHHEG
jgi:hypothetical protein